MTDTHSGRRSLWRTPMVVVPGTVVALLCLLAALAPFLFADAAKVTDVTAALQPPGDGHLFGTDRTGRDIGLRILAGSTLSLALALGATALTVVLGTVLGLAPLLLGRRTGRAVGALVTILLAFPGLLLVLFFGVIWGAGAGGAMLAVALAGAPAFARLTHNLAAEAARSDYVLAARVLGLNRFQVTVRHVLPNIADALVIIAASAAGGSLMVFAGLSFLGIGVQPPDDDWGRLLNEGLSRIWSNPAAALGPALMIVIAGLAFNMLGEGLAVALGRTAPAPGLFPRRPVGPAVPLSLPEAGPRPLLRVRDLRVTAPGPDGPVALVEGVSFDLDRGQTLGIVGESGSGKSVTVAAVAGLLPGSLRADATELRYDGHDLTVRPKGDTARKLGTEIAVVFQDPMTSLNPRIRVGRQMTESTRFHLDRSEADATDRAESLLRMVGLTDPRRVLQQYPHQLSGGMRQRISIATGLMGPVRLILADEPTTALDVTVQGQVLEQLRQAREETGTAVVLISHDIGVVTAVCDRVLVMYAGRVVEDAPADVVSRGGHHPYTQALLGSLVRMDTPPRADLPHLPGSPPPPAARPQGCAFAARCPRRLDRCDQQEPPLAEVTQDGRIACWNPAPAPVTVDKESVDV